MTAGEIVALVLIAIMLGPIWVLMIWEAIGAVGEMYRALWELIRGRLFAPPPPPDNLVVLDDFRYGGSE